MLDLPYMAQMDAAIGIAELAGPAKGGLRISAPLAFEGEGSWASVSKVQPESLSAVFMPPEHMVLRQPFSESQEGQEWLFRTYEDGKVEMVIPSLEWLVGQDPVLTDTVRGLLTTLWAIVVSRALQAHFPLGRTTVSVFQDPTEQERKAILRLTCNASGAQALAFWDSLEPDLQNWLETLRENVRTTFISKLGLRVHWQ